VRLAELERRVSSLGELGRIMDAMRSLASMRLQEALRSLASAAVYATALEQAVRDSLAIAARRRPDARRGDERGRSVLILLTSEHGFVGAFNDKLLEVAAAQIAAAGGTSTHVMVLGSRGAALALERGLDVDWWRPAATRIESIPESVRMLQQSLYPRIATGEATRVRVIGARYQRAGRSSIATRSVYPLELAPSGPGDPAGARRESVPGTSSATARRPVSWGRLELPPLHNLGGAVLLEGLTAQYLLARLTEMAVESLASENAARFATMDSTHDNVGRKLDEYRLAASRARQEEVTTELLELATGAEAVR
jgi:F-type H+-transporting ATPase subunit gamma